MLARENYSMHKKIVNKKDPRFRAHCVSWTTGYEIAEFLESILNSFGDISVKYFGSSS